MDSYKRLESCASAKQEGSQNKTNRNETKRQRTALESTEDDFEEFVALMDRIQYMKTKQMSFSISEEILIREDLDVKVTRAKSRCLPSFEWEDFCVPAQRGMCSLDMIYNPSRSEEKGKQGIRSDNYLQMKASSDAYDRCPAESFDLNVQVEASDLEL